MLLLVTIGLVLVGAVSLVIGFVSNSLAPIYLSIACSVIAGIVLVVFSRMSKRQEAGGPSASGFQPASSSGSTWTPPPPPPPPPSYTPPPPPAPVGEPEPVAAAPAPRASAAASAVALDDFPVAGYDTLRVSRILPALDDLDLDELDIVREREEEGKNRTTVLRRIDALMDEREAEEATGTAAVPPPVMDGDDFEEDDGAGLETEVDDNLAPELEDFEEEEDEDDFAGLAAEPQERTAVMPAVSAGDNFPIPDYDNLPVARILPLLDDLDDDELDMVAEREEQGRNRAAILDRIDDMFEPLDEQAPPPPPPPPPAPVKRSPAKKIAVKKAPVVKASPAKVSPVKKAATVKRTPTKTAAAKSTPVKKAAVATAPPVKRPSPVTKVATKKAVAAKKRPAAVKKAVKKR